MKIQALIAGSLLLASSAVMAAPVDLTDWEADGLGKWDLKNGNLSVLQSVDTMLPTVFFDGQNKNSQGKTLSSTVTVNDTGNDFIGFVLGYNDGDDKNGAADYLVIDWKQANQTDQGGPGGRLATAGLAISRVSGAMNHGDFWDHSGVVTELQRAATLGNDGWMDGVTYTFDLVFTATQVQVMVDGKLELNITGNFDDGSFGFYNFMQGNVLYSGIQEDVAAIAVPVPAPLALLGLGLLGLGLSRRAKMW